MNIFGQAAEDYQKYRKGYPQELWDFLFSIAPVRSAILDLGCGTGKSTEPLVGRALRITGIDPDPAMLAVAVERANKLGLDIEYVEASAENIPFKDSSFDVVIAGKAFHWFANACAFLEIKRVLRPDGLFFVFLTRDKDYLSENNVDSGILKKYGWNIENPDAREQDGIKELFIKNGFKKVEMKEISYVEKYTLDERFGQEVLTSSAFLKLSHVLKTKLAKEAREDLASKLGGRSHFEIQQVIHVVYGFR